MRTSGRSAWRWHRRRPGLRWSPDRSSGWPCCAGGATPEPSRVGRNSGRLSPPIRQETMMPSREGAVAGALDFFDSNGFRDRLAELVAIPSTSQDAGHEADVRHYLDGAIRPWLQRMGFAVTVHANPVAGFWPILTSERLEGPAR